jgi:hypothetical protein
MPAPDPTPDLATAIYRELKDGDIPDDVAAVLQARLNLPDVPVGWEDALLDAGLGSEDTGRWFLWQWTERAQVQGTGRASVVISVPGSWAGPNTYNTLRFPRVQTEVYADIDRDETRGPYVRTAPKKGEDIWVVLDALLHRPGQRNMHWGDANGRVRVVSSVRNSGEPDRNEVPDTDGVWRILCSYAIELG